MVRLPAVPRYTSLFQMAFRVGRFASGTLIRQRQDHTSMFVSAARIAPGDSSFAPTAAGTISDAGFAGKPSSFVGAV